MNTYLKNGLMVLALAGIAGGSFVLAQTTPTLSGPSPTPPAAGTGMRGPGAMGTARGPGSHQPHMDIAILRLREARNQLDLAEHDKGGFREKAIASIDQAIKDVQAGIDYAEAHPEEFPNAARGPRAGARGARGTAAETVTPPTASGG